MIIHRVKKNESIADIARKYGTNPKFILENNGSVESLKNKLNPILIDIKTQIVKQ